MVMTDKKLTPKTFFRKICRTLAEVEALPKKNRNSASFKASVAALENAAIALVPEIVSSGLYNQQLGEAATTGSIAVISAFPSAPPATILRSGMDTKCRDYIERAPAEALALLHARGYCFRLDVEALMLRALRRKEPALQDFLVQNADTLGDEFNWLFSMTSKHIGKAPEFLSAYLAAAVPANTETAQLAFGFAQRTLNGLAYSLLVNSGIPRDFNGGTMIPLGIEMGLSRLSKHAELLIFGHGKDIASFWRQPEAIAAASGLFKFDAHA